MIFKLLEEHPGKAIGLAIGLIIGIIFLIVGFWKTLIFTGFVVGGLYIGKKYDNREDIRDIIEEIIPNKFLK